MRTRYTAEQLSGKLNARVGQNAVFWSDAEALDALNEALAVWQALTGEWTYTITGVPTPSAEAPGFFNAPHQIASLQRVKYSGSALEQVTLKELDGMNPGWRDDSAGAPRLWAAEGLEVFALSPLPALTPEITLEGYADAPRLTADPWSYVDLGDEELVRVLDYAHWYLSFKEGVKEGVENSGELLQNLVHAASLRNARLRQSAMFREYAGDRRDEWGQHQPRAPQKKVGIRRRTQEQE